MEIMFRSMSDKDWEKVSEIYQQGLATGNASFEQHVPSREVWDNAHLKKCRIIVLIENEVAGWAALSPVSGRSVYAGVAEVSVYVAEKYHGNKIGTMLLGKLIVESEKENLWTLQASIFPENISSLKIHEKSGFRKVGRRERIGKMNDQWRDTILMERRSHNIS